VVGAGIQLPAQTVTVDPTLLTSGYMNWSPVANDAGGYGGSGNSGWGLSALQANFSGSDLTLNPNVNTYAAGNDYWVNADGSGANLMDANIYNETTGTYVGTTLTFTFDVVANTLAGPYSSEAFIKDFSSGYALVNSVTTPLTPGVDSISLLTSGTATDHIQFGFETFGPDTNPSSPAASEYATIDPVAAPEPATLALAGLGGAALVASLRRRRQ
jgi:hypothetical protein